MKLFKPRSFTYIFLHRKNNNDVEKAKTIHYAVTEIKYLGD